MSKSKAQEMQEQLLQLTEIVGKLSDELAGLKVQKPSTPKVVIEDGELPPQSTFSTRGLPRPNVSYVLLGIPPSGSGLQPQAVKCCVLLSKAADVTNISEEEAMAIIKTERARAYLRSRQDPWHVFQYYRAKLIEKDFLRMKS